MVSQELIELLKYMEHSTDEVSEQCKSERIQKMHRRVCRIKASEKTEVKYMQAWEEKLLERQKEKRELLRKMNHKMSIEEIADVLDMTVEDALEFFDKIPKIKQKIPNTPMFCNRYSFTSLGLDCKKAILAAVLIVV